MSQAFDIVIDSEVSVSGYGREAVYGLNATYKRSIFYLMSSMQLCGSQRFDTKMSVRTSSQNNDESLAQDFQKKLSDASRKHGIFDYVKHKKSQVKSGKTGSVMYNTMKMFSTKA